MDKLARMLSKYAMLASMLLESKYAIVGKYAFVCRRQKACTLVLGDLKRSWVDLQRSAEEPRGSVPAPEAAAKRPKIFSRTPPTLMTLKILPCRP